MNYIERRIARTRVEMKNRGAGALLVTNNFNLGWISGFSGSTGFVFLTSDRAVLATDSRYTGQAAVEAPDFEQVKLLGTGPEDLIELARELGCRDLAIEANHTTIRQYEALQAKAGREIALHLQDRIIDDLRLVKDYGEIELMELACAAGDRAFGHILPFLKPGVSERDVMLELEWYMRRDEGGEVAFDTIVASGVRSALPHGRASTKVIESGDFVTLDFGVRLNGYCSDITRTVVVGEPTEKQREVYAVVHDALISSIDSILPGASGKAVDAVARDIISAAGYGDYFGHGLGHSLGRAVHDGPGLSVRSDVVLGAGMIMTVEPGIYLPGWGGCRIEHDVLVTETGYRILTHSTTELLSL